MKEYNVFFGKLVSLTSYMNEGYDIIICFSLGRLSAPISYVNERYVRPWRMLRRSCTW